MLFIKLCDWCFVQVQKTSEIRLKHLTTACDEVTKFEEELGKFEEWLTQSSKELDRQEELIRDLDNFSRVMEQQKVGEQEGKLKKWGSRCLWGLISNMNGFKIIIFVYTYTYSSYCKSDVTQ